MSGFLAWALLTLALSGTLVLLSLAGLPFLITGAVMLGLRRRMEPGEPWVNRLLLGGPATSGGDRVVMTSPDMIYMIGVYCVRQEPAILHCAVPGRETYWCISLYSRNTDNFYVRNDRASQEREFDLVLTGPKGGYRKTGSEEVVEAPQSRGIVLIRAVVKDREDQEEVARVQATLKLTTITPWSQVPARVCEPDSL